MIIERQSIVDAPAEQVWARVVTPEGINDEVRPWMTMSMPRGAKNLDRRHRAGRRRPSAAAGCACSGCCRSTTTDLTIAELRPRPRFRRAVDDAQHAPAGATSAPSSPTVTPKPLCAIASHSSSGLRCAR